jgi:hypothetical protein
MKSDRGCDGSCVVNNAMYKNVMDAIEKRIQPTTKNDLGVDCIDKAELLKAMYTWDKFGYTARYGLERLDKDDKDFVPYVKYDDMVNCVKNMPPATPQEPRWIPVSERLPEDRELVLCSSKRGGVFEGKYFDDETDCQWYAFRNDEFVRNDVIDAWMPLPEPYREVEE